jgi:glutathione peroxidase
MMENIYTFEFMDSNSKGCTLSDYKGKVLLIVNTASECGFTKQYAELEALYQAYKDEGLVVLAFPCNQFGAQEPGSNAEISAFCQMNFGITFPVFSKIDVNGENAHPLFRFLKQQAPGILGSKRIKWNFTKFLVDQKGDVVGRFSPMTKPEKLTKRIQNLLSE